jgi:hypothetical protein
MRLLVLSSQSDLAALALGVLSAARRGMGCLRELPALVWGCALHAGELLFGSVAKLSPIGLENSLYRPRADAVSSRNACNADPAVVKRDDLGFGQRNARLPGGRAHRLSGLAQPSMDGGAADAELARDLMGGKAGAVQLDQIVSVQRRDFSGHVFNLETAGGWYAADGIITHNCRSTTVPVMKSWQDLGIDLEEAPDGTRASVDGQVPAEMTYGEWLKQQPRASVEDILGPKKAALFLDGKLPIDRFVDDTGHELSLDELEQREHKAWNRAFDQ